MERRGEKGNGGEGLCRLGSWSVVYFSLVYHLLLQNYLYCTVKVLLMVDFQQ